MTLKQAPVGQPLGAAPAPAAPPAPGGAPKVAPSPQRFTPSQPAAPLPGTVVSGQTTGETPTPRNTLSPTTGHLETPLDEFDPSIFNSQMHPQRKQ
jgi:hypothetical protein